MGPGTGGPGAGVVGIVPLGINCDPGVDGPPGDIAGTLLDLVAQGEAAQPLSPTAKSRTIKKPGEFDRVVIVSPWKPRGFPYNRGRMIIKTPKRLKVKSTKEQLSASSP